MSIMARRIGRLWACGHNRLIKPSNGSGLDLAAILANRASLSVAFALKVSADGSRKSLFHDNRDETAILCRSIAASDRRRTHLSVPKSVASSSRHGRRVSPCHRLDFSSECHPQTGAAPGHLLLFSRIPGTMELLVPGPAPMEWSVAAERHCLRPQTSFPQLR